MSFSGGRAPGVCSGRDTARPTASGLISACALDEQGTDTCALIAGADGEYELARPGPALVDLANSNETNRATVQDCHPHIVLRRGADGFDGTGLS